MSGSELAGFVGALAADPPGPASGSAAAVAVAMAGALAELAARRSGEAESEAQAAAVRARSLPLADADARAYAEVLGSRGNERRAALACASDVLREIAAAAVEAHRVAESLIGRVEGPLRGEVTTAVALAEAARSAVEQLIRINAEDSP
ncbi:MAG: cyclodeaminase/cyclohydrolase family protein [Gaiellaceae bacterium]